MNTQLHTTSNKVRNDLEVATIKKKIVIGTLSLETRMSLYPVIIMQAASSYQFIMTRSNWFLSDY